MGRVKFAVKEIKYQNTIKMEDDEPMEEDFEEYEEVESMMHNINDEES